MKRLILILLLLPCVLKGQIITNFAGGGATWGDNGLAVIAKTAYPACGAFDYVGNYYFLNGPLGSSRVRMVDTAGYIYTVVGTGVQGFSGDGGPAIAAQLGQVNGVAIDSTGNIYISDITSNRIRKVDAVTHIINTVAGTGTYGSNGDGGPALSADIAPGNLCADNDGTIYFLGYNNRIRRIDTNGIITTIAGTGNQGYSGDGGQAILADLWLTVGICLDHRGNLIFGSQTRIRKINLATGIISTIAGGSTSMYNGDEIPAINANVREYGICADAFGNVYISDYTNDRIRQIDTSGIIHTVAGTGVAGYSGDGGLATEAQINHTQGVAADACGNICIADENNSRIRKVTFYPNCKSIDSTTNVQLLSKNNSFLLYPNPSHNELTITGSNNTKDLSIINTMGQTVIAQNCNSTKTTINVSGLSNGLYFIVLKDEGNAVVFRGRFLKE